MAQHRGALVPSPCGSGGSGVLEVPVVLGLGRQPRRPSVQGPERPGAEPNGQRADRANPLTPGGLPLGTSGAPGRATNLQSRRPAAVDRQVGERPVDGLYRSDRPLGQVGDDDRGELVDLAVKGQFAPAGDDHHQHVDLVVAVPLDAIALAEPDQVGLQVLSIQPPQRPWMAPARREAGQVDRRDGVRHAAIFPSHTIAFRACGTGRGPPAEFPAAVHNGNRPACGPKQTWRVPINLAGPLLVNQEPATVAWFAIRLGPSEFGIFDAFLDDAGRQAHLGVQVAAP